MFNKKDVNHDLPLHLRKIVDLLEGETQRRRTDVSINA